MQYNYLIAGLPDLRMDATNAPQPADLLDELTQALTEDDRALLDLIRLQHDNQNLLRLLDNKDAPLNPLGTLQRQDWAELISLMDETEQPKDPRLKPYIIDFYRSLADTETDNTLREDRLATYYYDYAARCSNTFVAAWFTFCLNLNNVLTAQTCRNLGWDTKTYIVGNNDVAQMLRSQTGRDLRLTDEFEEADAVMAIAEEQNLLTRERRIDQLKWQWIEEHTEYRTFSIDRVLAYWLQCQIIHRWDNLDTESGRQIFRSMLDEMKQGVKFGQ